MSFLLVTVICSVILLIICLICNYVGFVQGHKSAEKIWSKAIDEIVEVHNKSLKELESYILAYINKDIPHDR